MLLLLLLTFTLSLLVLSLLLFKLATLTPLETTLLVERDDWVSACVLRMLLTETELFNAD